MSNVSLEAEYTYDIEDIVVWCRFNRIPVIVRGIDPRMKKPYLQIPSVIGSKRLTIQLARSLLYSYNKRAVVVREQDATLVRLRMP